MYISKLFDSKTHAKAEHNETNNCIAPDVMIMHS